jgi:hypothetical protein
MTEAQYWRQRYEMLMATFTDAVKSAIVANATPRMLADAESYEAGRAMAFNEATYAIGIDTAEGVHTVVVYRRVPGQPSTLVASQRLPDDTREQYAQLVETMGMQGYGALAMAAAIRKGGQP